MKIKDLAGLSAPATALINRVAECLGAVAHPFQTVRNAKADAEAEVIRAKGKARAESEAKKRIKTRCGSSRIYPCKQPGIWATTLHCNALTDFNFRFLWSPLKAKIAQ